MRKAKHYEVLYRKNEDNGRIMIEIALNNYLEFFHEWDNSSFKKRDIHGELAQFLDICSEDIPMRKKLEIVFSLNLDAMSQEKEEQIRFSYRNYYSSVQRLEKRKLKKLIRISVLLVCMSILLLTAYGFMFDRKTNSIFARVLLESLLIGGWVFTWEAMHLLFIDISEPFHRRREIKRFLDASISFQYKKLT